MDAAFIECLALFIGFLGLAGPALGLAGLARRKQGAAWSAVALAFCAVLLAGASWAAWLGWSATFWGPTLALAGLLLSLNAARGDRLTRALRSPRLRWGVMLLACPLLALWLGWRVQVAVEESSPDYVPEPWVERIAQSKEPVTVTTDAGRTLTAHRVGAVNYAEESREADAKMTSQWAGRLILMAASDPSHNCHGWVYSGGKYWISGEAVDTILADNGYREVTKPRPGDVIAYRDNKGAVTHSGVVRSSDGVVVIESKWGAQARYLHRPEDQPFEMTYTYHRSERRGHVLAGVGDGAEVPATAE